MPDSRTRRYRMRKAAAQQHRCYYCQFPMWTDCADNFAKTHGITLQEAKRFRCTAEHLKAVCDGGTSCLGNVVAACEFCNRKRHDRDKQLAPERYMVLVRKRVAKQSWHPPTLHKLRQVDGTHG